MNVNAMFPGTYLKAADLQGRKVTLTIDRVQLEEVGGEHKPILYFQGTERGLVLNKTNANVIAEMYGTETDNWGGSRITLFPARVPFQDKIVDAIRVELAQSTLSRVAAHQAPMRQQQSTPGPAAGMPLQSRNGNGNGHHALPVADPAPLNDEIPF